MEKVLIWTQTARIRFQPQAILPLSDLKKGKVSRVAGPGIVARDMLGRQMYEVVRVGEEGLIGEIIRIEEDKATVQVYEETAGIRAGGVGERTGKALAVERGPGRSGHISDGIL